MLMITGAHGITPIRPASATASPADLANSSSADQGLSGNEQLMQIVRQIACGLITDAILDTTAIPLETVTNSSRSNQTATTQLPSQGKENVKEFHSLFKFSNIALQIVPAP